MGFWWGFGEFVPSQHWNWAPVIARMGGRLGEDVGFGGFAFALKLPELLNRNLPTVRSKLGQTSSFPNGPQIWFPIGQ